MRYLGAQDKPPEPDRKLGTAEDREARWLRNEPCGCAVGASWVRRGCTEAGNRESGAVLGFREVAAHGTLTIVQFSVRFGHLTSVQKPWSAARPEELESPTF
jgi:hypothetical protein